MVKLRPPSGGAISCISSSYPTYLVTNKDRQRLPKKQTADADGYNNPNDTCDFFDYKKERQVKVQEYDRVLQDMVAQESNYKEEKDKERDGCAFSYTHLNITVLAENDPKSSQVMERPPPPPPPPKTDDNDSSDSSSSSSEGTEKGEEETEEEKAKRVLFESICDPKPNVNHSKISIYGTSVIRGPSNLSNMSQACFRNNVIERTGRPEDIIDLLLEKQPNQLEFGYVAPSLSTYLAEKIAATNCPQVVELGDVFQESTIPVFNKLLAACSNPSGSGPKVLRIRTKEFAPYTHLLSLEEGMRRNTSVCTLDVAEACLSDYNAESFSRLVAMAITSLPNVNALDLSETRVKGKPHAELLDPLLDVTPTNQKVSAVKLRGSRLPEEIMNRLANGVCALPVLEELNVSSTNCGQKVIASIADLLKRDRCTLKTLNMTSMLPQVIDLSPILEALNANASLMALKIGGNDLPPGTVKRLAEALSTNTTLSHLYLDTLYDFDFGTFFSFLSQMKGLVWLDISDNFLEDACLQVLAKQIHSSDLSLRHIEAVDVQCSETGLQNLVEAVDKVEGTSANVSHLDVSKIDDWPLTKSLYLKTKDDKTVVPPRRYGEGEKIVGDAKLLANFVQSKMGSLKNGTVQPKDCILFLTPLKSAPEQGLGIEIRHFSDADKYSPNDNERQSFEFHPGSKETGDAAEFIASLGIPRITVQQAMSNAGISRSVAVATKVASMASSSLQSLELTCVELDDAKDCEIVPNVPMMGTMTRLKLSSVKLGKPIADMIAWVLSSSRIEQLELEGPKCKDPEAMKTVRRGFEQNESLRTLKVSSGSPYPVLYTLSEEDDLSEEALLELVIGIGFLQGIDVEINFHKANQEIIDAFCNSMSLNKCRKCEVYFGDECGSVDLSPLGNSLQGEAKSSLEFLSLSSEKLFQDEGVDSLAKALSVNAKIDALSITPSSLSAVASASFYTAMGAMKGLKHLEFPEARSGGDRGNCETAVNALVEALQSCSRLESLTLHDYQHATELFPAVMEALKLSTPSTLSAVDLRFGSDSQMDQLCSAIAANTTIKEMTTMSPYGCKDFKEKLVRALSQNSTLESLTIIGGSPEEIEELVVALLPEMAKGLKNFCIDVREYASALWNDEKKMGLLEKAKGLPFSVMFLAKD